MLRLTLNEDLARTFLLFMSDSWKQQNLLERTCPDLPTHPTQFRGALLSLNASLPPQELSSPTGLCMMLESGTVFPLALVDFGPGCGTSFPVGEQCYMGENSSPPRQRVRAKPFETLSPSQFRHGPAQRVAVSASLFFPDASTPPGLQP